MNSPLALLIAVAVALILFEVVTRNRRTNPRSYTLATHFTGGAYETAAYYGGRHICTAVHICGTASRAQALASAQQHVIAAYRLPC